jgi:hypothetical protein
VSGLRNETDGEEAVSFLRTIAGACLESLPILRRQRAGRSTVHRNPRQRGEGTSPDAANEHPVGNRCERGRRDSHLVGWTAGE